MRFFKSMNALLLSSIFITAILYVSNTNELYEYPKMFFIYLVALVLVAFSLIGRVWNYSFLRKLPIPVLIFLVAFLISTMFSENLYTSVWGYYTRFNGGLLSVLSFLVIFSFASKLYDSEGFHKFFNISIFILIPVGFLSLMQHFGIGGDPVTRAYSSFGQPNWAAQFAVMLLPISIFFSLSTPYKKSIYYYVIYGFGYCLLWYSYSISGFLGFALSFISLIFFLYRLEILKANVKRIGIFLLISLLISISSPGIFKDKIDAIMEDMQNIISYSTKVYAATTSATTKISDPGFIRWGMWTGSIRMWIHSPKTILLGYGPETFAYYYQPYREKSLNYSSEWDYVLNKPHNYYIELLVELGLVGLVSYLYLLFWIYKRLPLYLRPSLIAYTVTNLFGWPVVPTALLFWFFGACAYVNKDN